MSSARHTRSILTFIMAAGGTFAAIAIAYELGFDKLGVSREYAADVPAAEQSGVQEDAAVADDPNEQPRPTRRRRARRPKTKSKTKADVKPAPKPEKPKPPPGPSIEMPTTGSIRAHRLPQGVSVDDLKKRFSQNRGPIERCLKKSIKAGEKFAGTVYLQMTIDQWGKVSESHIKNSELDYTVLGRCILARTGGGGYPAGDKPITVGFPMRVVRPD